MKISPQGTVSGIERLWPVLFCAVLMGYSGDMVLAGSEILQATQEHLQDRQPLSFNREQTEFMLSQSQPGDRILYTSTMCMAYYFLHGAMQRGAVYYHPDFAGTKVETEWLKRPDLRYAVTYNPIVYHPAYAGLDEKDQCISFPEFRYSPLSGRRAQHPVSKEGFIRASDFRWIQVEFKEKQQPRPVRLLVKNPGGPSELLVALVNERAETAGQSDHKYLVSQKWTGWVELKIADFPTDAPFHQLRILLPKGDSGLGIGGISLGNNKFNWPWEQKATIVLMPRQSGSETVYLSFDPAKMLPRLGDGYQINVLDDSGSSVLFQIK